MPVFFARRKPHHITRPDLLDRAAQPLHTAAARDDDQRLSERMRVPRGPSTRFERDGSTRNTSRSWRLKQGIDAYRPGEVFGGSFARWLRARALMSIDVSSVLPF